MARPLKEVDPAKVRDLASIGCVDEEIARLCGCSADTLTRRFRQELEDGRAELKMSLRRKQVELAKTGDKTMLIWLGKNLLGQSEPRGHVQVDVNKTTPEEQAIPTAQLLHIVKGGGE